VSRCVRWATSKRALRATCARSRARSWARSTARRPQAGELRRSQNWIGGTRPGNAAFVPPPPQQVAGLLTDLERFIHAADADLPPLVRIALIHAQFETIDPFLDGNGRIGRLLIAALMEHWALLREPLMYLSGYLKQHQAEYYRRLSAIRDDGDWEGWVSFFLEGVAMASAEAERSIIDVASLITADRKRLLESPKAGPISYRLFELLPTMPRFSVEHVRQRLETTFPTAGAAVKLLQDLGILTELTGQKKNRVYSYQAYVDLLSRCRTAATPIAAGPLSCQQVPAAPALPPVSDQLRCGRLMWPSGRTEVDRLTLMLAHP